MDREIERFMELLNDILPRYSSLLRKKDMSHEEVTELGELEHYLIEINAKILDIKNKIQNDLFGQTIDTYYRLKIKTIHQLVRELRYIKKNESEHAIAHVREKISTWQISLMGLIRNRSLSLPNLLKIGQINYMLWKLSKKAVTNKGFGI